MIEIKAIIYIVIPVFLQYFLFNIYGKQGNFYKLPKDILDKIKSNPKDLDKFDREILFDVLQIKNISNEAINFISKNSENPLKYICIFSKIEKKYLDFNERNISINSKYIIKNDVILTKKIFEFFYYIFAFISLHFIVHNFFINKINFIDTNTLFLLSGFGIIIAIKCAIHSISLDMANDLVNLSNSNQEDGTMNNTVVI